MTRALERHGAASGSGAPVETIPDRRFVRDLFSWLAPRYEQALLGYSFGQDLRWKHVMLEQLRLESGERALDLASGTGLVLERLIRRLGASAVVGLDVNRPMLRRAWEQDPGRRLVQASAERLPFASGSFDVVTAGYLFKYVQLDRFLREVRRVLRPEGRLAGYDFSGPLDQTATGSLYGVYLRRILPWLGRRRARTDAGWPALLRFLSQVSDNSGWERRVEAALAATGFTEVRRVPSLGGAVTWVWATATDGGQRGPD